MAGAAQGVPGYSAHVNSRIASSSGPLQARLHNFVKYALLQQLVPPGATVCDLYCGRGVDTEKWARAQIGRYVGVDFAASTLEEAREQWNNHNRPYPADFCEVDPSTANLETELRHMGLPADFVTCMGHLQDCFFEEEMVRSLLHNVASILKPGGYFFGITADSSTIWSKYQKVVEGAHKAGSLRVLPRVNSEHYAISFEDDRFTPFGTKYTLQFADGVISESQQLIHFPSLIRLAEEVGLEYIELQNLQEFYDDYRIQFSDILRATCANLVDPKGKLPQFAHDILSLYTTFIFKKADQCEPDFILSPLPLAGEDQLETCSEEAFDGNMAPHGEHCSPADEPIITARRLPVEFSIQNEAKENIDWRSEEDNRGCPATIQPEGNSHQSRPGDGYKDDGQDLHSSNYSKQSDRCDKEEVAFDAKAAADKVNVNSGRLGKEDKEDPEKHVFDKSLELEGGHLMEPTKNPRQGLSVDCRQRYRESMEMEQNQDVLEGQCEMPQQRGTPLSVDSRSPLGEVKQHTDVADEVGGSQLCSENGDESMMDLPKGNPSSVADLKMGEFIKEQKEESSVENEASEANVLKKCDVASSSGEHALGPSKSSPCMEGLSTPSLKSTSLVEHEFEEQRRSDLQSAGSESGDPTHSKNEVHVKDTEIRTPPNVRARAFLANINNGVEGDRNSHKHSTGRIDTCGKEEPCSGISKRSPFGGSQSGQQQYRGMQPLSKPHHHHSSYSEERQEYSQGSRHNSHTSHNPRMSRDRDGDHRSNLLSPNQRGDSHRGRSRNALNSPNVIPFLHFVPQTEFPVFQSPNTPGILGPGPPPLRLAEPFSPFWPIPSPQERRMPSKNRSSRKLGGDREAFGSRGRKESPKRHWKDSPPPGTES